MPHKKTNPDIQERKEGNPMDANKKDEMTGKKEFTKLIVKDAKGNKYTLEFNARVVKNMERKGFKIDTDYPYTLIDDLFLGSMQMHHKGITADRAKEVWNAQRNKDELLAALIQLYSMPFEELMAEPEENDNADPTWETA